MLRTELGVSSMPVLVMQTPAVFLNDVFPEELATFYHVSIGNEAIPGLHWVLVLFLIPVG